LQRLSGGKHTSAIQKAELQSQILTSGRVAYEKRQCTENLGIKEQSAPSGRAVRGLYPQCPGAASPQRCSASAWQTLWPYTWTADSARSCWPCSTVHDSARKAARLTSITVAPSYLVHPILPVHETSRVGWQKALHGLPICQPCNHEMHRGSTRLTWHR
jgi:hypothetical protein